MTPSGTFRKLGICCLAMFTIATVSLGSQTAERHSYPKLDRLPPGELLLSSGRAVLPEDFVPRGVYRRGLTFTKAAEGWVATLYDDSAGYCTIGYGHLIKKANCNGTEPPEFRRGISKDRGGELLGTDLRTSQYAVSTMVRGTLTDGQFAALTDFVFNVGSTNFRKSTLLDAINAKQLDRIPGQFRRWVLAGGRQQAGLRKRRDGEVDLFFDGLPRPKGVSVPGENMSPIDIGQGEQR